MTRWLIENRGLKLVSVGLATLLWFIVNNIVSGSRTVENVPLQVKVTSDRTVVDQSADAVSIEVRGTREDVWQVSAQNFAAVVDLTRDDRVGVRELRLSPRMIQHPTRVQVVTVEPRYVTVRVAAARAVDSPDSGGVQDQQ
jgi:YbbR domain-containing protein